MQPSDLFVYWLILVLAGYLALLLMMGVRRVRYGKQPTAAGEVQVDGSRVEARHGADPATLVGLFVLAASLFGMTISLAIGLSALDFLTNAPSGIWSGPGFFMLGFLILAGYSLGWSIWIGLGRWGVRIDVPARAVESWWGLVVPIRTRQRRLDEFRFVVIRSGPKRLFSRTPTFTLHLEGTGKPLLLDRNTCTTRDQAGQLAQRLAAIGGLKVEDQTKR